MPMNDTLDRLPADAAAGSVVEIFIVRDASGRRVALKRLVKSRATSTACADAADHTL